MIAVVSLLEMTKHIDTKASREGRLCEKVPTIDTSIKKVTNFYSLKRSSYAKN